jgi:predicted ATPase
LPARPSAEHGLGLHHDPDDYGLYLAPFGEHPVVACHGWASLALWFLGWPDRALSHAEQAVAVARRHPYSLTTAEVQLAFLHQHRGERDATLRWAEQAIATATEHGFPIRLLQATILRGWALGAADVLRGGLEAYRATGAEMEVPYYLGLLAESLGSSGLTDQGLTAVDQALGMVGASYPFFYEAELHRLRGDLLLGRHDRGAAEAYRLAVDVATRQQARSLALRATLRLCRLADPAGRAAALAGLRDLYDRFEEGFDTPDLRAARALLS